MSERNLKEFLEDHLHVTATRYRLERLTAQLDSVQEEAIRAGAEAMYLHLRAISGMSIGTVGERDLDAIVARVLEEYPA